MFAQFSTWARVLTLSLLAGVFLTACSGVSSSSTPDSVAYQSTFDRVVTASAEAAVDAGLTVESGDRAPGGEYIIIASKFERLRGQREPIRVASVEITVKEVSGGEVNVTVEQEKTSRTSTIGTSSSEQIDYPRRIYRRLERRLKS